MSFDYAAYQKQVRDAVFNSLEDLLGTYTFKTESGVYETPAIKLDDGTVLPDDVPKPEVTGLEAIITPYPQIPLRPQIGGSYEGQIQVRVTLKQWDVTQRTLTAFERLQALEYQVENPVIVPRNPSIDNIETISFLLVGYWDFG